MEIYTIVYKWVRMNRNLFIGLFVISLILVGGCGTTGEVVKETSTNNDKIDLVLGVDDKINIASVGDIGNEREFYCSAVKPLINCYCSESGGCWLGGAINYKNGVYITIQQIKNDAYNKQGDLIFSKTEDIQIARFLDGYPLQDVKIGDKVKTTITKIKYAKVQDYNCEIINEVICSDEHYVIREDKL